MSSFFATMFDEKLVINEIFLQGMMNSGHKGSKKFVHKGPFFHPTSTRVFRGPHVSSPCKICFWKIKHVSSQGWDFVHRGCVGGGGGRI